jgi:peptidoglycan/LPS O-acetylase OafA/YrhL
MSESPAHARPERFAALDGVRAGAAYAIMATHVGFEAGRSFGAYPVAPWLSRLDAAVPIFLMLSGFLLYRPFLIDALRGGPPPDSMRFYWRRALRVLPAYWIAVTVTLGLLSSRPASFGDWISYLSLTEIYTGHDHDSSLSHLWTLALEVSFYLVLPLLARSLRRSRGNAERIVASQCALFGAMVILSIGWQVVAMQVPSLGYQATAKWLFGSLDWFAGGMLLALLSVLPDSCASLRGARTALRQWAASLGLCWTLAVVLYWLSSLPLAGPLDLGTPTTWQHLSKHLLQGGVVFFLLLPLTAAGGRSSADSPAARVLGGRTARFLGEISYGVYLWHLPMLILIQRVFRIPIFQGHFWAFLLLTGASSTLIASLSWPFIERPLLRRFSSPGWRNSTAASTASTTAMTHNA